MPADTTVAATASSGHSIAVTGLEAAQSCPNDASSHLGDAVVGLVLLLALTGLIFLLARAHPPKRK